MDLAEQVQQMRLVHRLEKDAERDLMDTETMQDRSWQLLRRVADYAGESYTAMRIDNVDERLRDRGAPLWLAAILTVAVPLIPVSALTGAFVLGLTKRTQWFLTRANRNLLQSNESIVEDRIGKWLEIKRTEDMLANCAKKWLEPELSNMLQNARDELAQTVGVGKQPFVQDSARKLIQNDVPVVQIKKSLDVWIDAQILAEDIACKKSRQEIRDLADIATSQDPEKEAKAKEAEAMKEGRAPSEERLPKTNKGALDQLKALRELPPPTLNPTPSSNDLDELRLAIESMIWVTTYDFTPRNWWRDTSLHSHSVMTDDITQNLVPEKLPAPLSKDLWKKLIERYIDPADAERKTYKQVGDSSNLAGVMGPPAPGAKKWSPEYRLSHYFSQILYPRINEENAEMVQRFSALSLPTPTPQ